MGVVYHTHYLVWCEVGRTDLLRALGRGYAGLEGDGLRLAVAHAAVRYVRPARYDDVVEVVTRLGGAQSRMVSFVYELFGVDPDRGLLATAETRLVALDTEGRPRRMPDDLLALLRSASRSVPRKLTPERPGPRADTSALE
jgi:acyl-CoA thioester hydrolase